MAKLVLNNKLFTKWQGHSEPEYLPPYYLPETLNALQKDFLEKNQLRIVELIGSPQLPSPKNGPENNKFANITVHPPEMVQARNVESLITWTQPSFP